MNRRFAVISLILCSSIAFAQQSPTKAILAGRLIDVRTGKVSNNAYVIIGKDRVLQIAESAPTGVTVIDLSKYTVLPGLIDSHGHILGNPKDQSSTGSLRISSAQKAIWGVHNLQTWLDHGFTAMRDACEGDSGYGQFALRDSVEKGLIHGPRIVSAGGCVLHFPSVSRNLDAL